MIERAQIMFKHTTSIATVCLSGTLPTKLRAIAAAGFESIELFEDDLLRFPGSLADVRGICEELGLSICLYQPFRDLEGCATEKEFKMALERFELRLQWMKELGVDMILVVSNCRSDAVSFGSRQGTIKGGLIRLAARRLRTLGLGAS
jgi:4-hydroxyphenylpyruvate dioxygenase